MSANASFLFFTTFKIVTSWYDWICTNKWFYSIVNHIEDISIRDEWLNKFKNWSVDETIKLDLNLDSDCFTLTIIDLTDYSLLGGIGINIIMFLNDLKRVLIVINGSKQVFTLKEVDGETNRGKFGFLNIREFKNRMSEINCICCCVTFSNLLDEHLNYQKSFLKFIIIIIFA